jgi:hypothetical protein
VLGLPAAVYGTWAFWRSVDNVEGFHTQLSAVAPSLLTFRWERPIRLLAILWLFAILVLILVSEEASTERTFAIMTLILGSPLAMPNLIRLMLVSERLADAAGLPRVADVGQFTADQSDAGWRSDG